MRAVAPYLLAACLAMTHGAATSADGEDPRSAEFADKFAASAAHIAALPEADLKKFYLTCSRESVRGRLGGGEIQLCSIGYEELLQRSFGGDFRAFLAWRRDAVRRPATQEPARE